MDDKTRDNLISFIEEFRDALSMLNNSVIYLQEAVEGMKEGQKKTINDEKGRCSGC
ncbi:hypothetical protein SAMN05660484_00228 [Eubacterium ruminantium]|uniref:Uncharacterized protein n=1 Tax=Eubacterium ruminantium TaxID=42322 RepID=A0A1T4QVB5_9FIRM|nr:hypothetical protein [Eubacterium ruminantium]SCW28227.1 hypothetical protein SAMN05660484_00228 [Eubacterium ruminantium]SDM12241.1 hypothetical protein SAMN04490370_101114 [Eubacterium ruminantium]SKA07556.1 hypothetical protein SAMN02745110_02530 [Eubacterium ruminantium]